MNDTIAAATVKPLAISLEANFRDGGLTIYTPFGAGEKQHLGQITWDKDELELVVKLIGKIERFGTPGAVNDTIEWLENQGTDLEDNYRHLLFGYWFAGYER